MLLAIEHCQYFLLMRNTINKNTVATVFKNKKLHLHKPQFIHTLKPGNHKTLFECNCDI